MHKKTSQACVDLLGKTTFEQSERLETPRLFLRRFMAEDAFILREYRQDEETARYQYWDHQDYFRIHEAKAFVLAMAQSKPNQPGEWFQFAIAEKKNNKLLGDCAFRPNPEFPEEVLIGITIAPNNQGVGFAAEATARFIDYLVWELEKERIVAKVDRRNASSLRLLARLGFETISTSPAPSYFKGELVYESLLVLEAKMWRARTGRQPRP